MAVSRFSFYSRWLALLLLPCLACGVSAPVPTQAALPEESTGFTFYVAPTGSDLNPGSEDLPWRTLQHAAAALQPGDTVLIRGGIYHERLVPQNSGLPGQPITYAAYPSETPTLDGAGIAIPGGWGGLVDLSRREHLVVRGLRVSHSAGSGIFAYGAAHLLIQGNATYDTFSSGIGLWNSQHIEVNENEVTLACNDGDQEDITIAGSSDFTVLGNHVHDGGPGTHGGEGIDVKDGSHDGAVVGNHVHHLNRVGIYVDAWDKHTYNIQVYKNVVHDIAAMGFMLSSEQGGLLENVALFNNVAYHNKLVGIWISNCCRGAASHPMRNIALYHNTLVDNGWEDWGGGIGVENSEVQDLRIDNNLLSQNLYFQLAVTAALPANQLSARNNLIDGFRGTEDERRGEGCVEGDPLFVNAAAADFHLQAGSPAIDAALFLSLESPPTDLDGQPRPQDGDGDGTAAWDIGAVEFPAAGVLLYLPFVPCASPAL